MSVDIFNWINQLRTNPSSIIPQLSATSLTNKFVNTNPISPLKWSNALSDAAQEYMNEKSLFGAGNEANIFLTARNLFAATVCSPY